MPPIHLPHQLLLISADATLEQRVLRALPAHPGTELHSALDFVPCPDARGWLLVLFDTHTPPPRRRPHRDPAAAMTPAICLADPATAAITSHFAVQFEFFDSLHRGELPSKLAFVLRQHVREALLHRVRRDTPAVALTERRDWCELQSEMNNALAGILGNAELALDAGARLPAPLRQRLARIVDLAAQLRDLARLPGRSPLPAAASLPLQLPAVP